MFYISFYAPPRTHADGENHTTRICLTCDGMTGTKQDSSIERSHGLDETPENMVSTSTKTHIYIIDILLAGGTYMNSITSHGLKKRLFSFLKPLVFLSL